MSDDSDKSETVQMSRSENYLACIYYLSIFSVSEMVVTTELLFLMVLRRVASEHRLFTPQLLPMKLMNMIMNKHWMDCKIELIC